MSSRSPHPHRNERHDLELDKLIAENPALKRHLQITPLVVESKDVPDTAGYAKHRHIVYVDRHLARDAPEIDGQPYRVWRPALVDHEWMEKGLIDILGYEYLPAHEFASLWENRTVRRLGMKPYAYNQGLRPYIKRDEVEKITVPPRDLDCTPYRAPHQTDADRRIMARFRKLGVTDAQDGATEAGDEPEPPEPPEPAKPTKPVSEKRDRTARGAVGRSGDDGSHPAR